MDPSSSPRPEHGNAPAPPPDSDATARAQADLEDGLALRKSTRNDGLILVLAFFALCGFGLLVFLALALRGIRNH